MGMSSRFNKLEKMEVVIGRTRMREKINRNMTDVTELLDVDATVCAVATDEQTNEVSLHERLLSTQASLFEATELLSFSS